MCAREYSTFVQSTYIYITYFRAKNDYQIRIQNPAIQRYSLAFYSTVFTLLPDLYLRYYTLFYFLFVREYMFLCTACRKSRAFSECESNYELLFDWISRIEYYVRIVHYNTVLRVESVLYSDSLGL